MNSPLRAVLVLAPVLAIGGLVLLSTGNGSKPEAPRDREVRQADVSKDVRVPSRPGKPAVSAVQVVTRAPSAKASAAAEVPSENQLATDMHALEDSDPERALELARRARALWPDGPRAAEFAATEVKCLYRLGMPSEGRGVAEAMVNKYPTSPWAREVERQTGAHPYVDH